MKLGLKTTGSVPKVKIKTTDGVAKAVACACCDPCATGGHPEYLLVNGTCPVRRVLHNGQCQWIQSICGNEAPPPIYYSDVTVVAGHCPLNNALDINIELHWQPVDGLEYGYWSLGWDITPFYPFVYSPCVAPPPPPDEIATSFFLGIKIGPFSDGPTGTYLHDYFGSSWTIEVTAL